MKILFIQLPLIDHSYSYVHGNMDYAPAAITSYIKKNFNEITCITLPSVISNFCSDEIILKYIKFQNPDIICFSSYLWNIERNLIISKSIRIMMNSVLILFGGPEISEGSIVFKKKHPEVDIFISGEGEWFFDYFLSGKDISYIQIEENSVAVQSSNQLLESEQIIEPLSSNRLNTLNDGSVFLEMTRGCPYKCSYCFYSKNYNKIRELPFSLLTEIIQKRNYIKEIYILSPTFDRSKNFVSNLKILKSLNHSVKLHTEIRTDKITAKIAALLYDAGFKSLEVGLQSLNKRALKDVKRESNTEAELSGIENLINAGIDLKIGIIPGLPGDDINSFKQTVDILCERGFEDFIELYPLMILPGTAIREKSIKDKVIFQDKPPYFFLSGWNFKFSQIKDISNYLEEQTGMTAKVFYLPDFSDNKNPLFIKGINFDSKDFNDWPIDKVREVDTIVVDLHVKITKNENIIFKITNFIKKTDKSRLYNIIIYTDMIIDEDIIVNEIIESEEDNFHKRLNVFNSFRDGSIFHIFQICSNLETYYKTVKKYSFIISVLNVNISSFIELKKVNFNDIPLLIEDGIYYKIKEFLLLNYIENQEYVAFKNETEMQDFYNHTEAELVKLPYSFGIKNY